MANPTSTTKVQFHSVPVLSAASIETGHFYHDQDTNRFYLALGTTFQECKELTNEDIRQALANLTATQVKYGDDSTVAAALSDIYGKLDDVAVLSTLTGSATIASMSGNAVTIYDQVTEANGKISTGSVVATLKDVAVTGRANDVAFTSNTAGYATVSTVAGALEAVPSIVSTALDGYATEAYVGSQISNLDLRGDGTIASIGSDNVLTLHTGIAEADGVVSVLSNTVTLAPVATTGAAADVAYSATIGSTIVTNVDDALDALAAASGEGVASKTVYLKDDEEVTAGYLKTYGLYQGATQAGATLIGKIDIPKDLVVTSGKVVTVEDGVDSDGDTTSVDDGTYVKLAIANQTEKIYINVADLVDAYTAAQGATQVQLAISATNEISATLVAGGVGTTELADNAVTTAKLAEGAVTSTILASGAVTTAKLAAGAVTSDILASNAVQTANIADEQVTEAKLSSALIAKIEASSGVTAVAEGNENGKIAVSTRDGATGSITTTQVSVHGLQDTAYVALSTLGGAATASTASATSQTSNVKALTDFEIVNGVLVASSVKSVNISSMISTAKSEIIGTASDTASDNTIYGAKAYADSKELVWQVTA